MHSFLSKVFGRKKAEDKPVSPTVLSPGELLDGKFEAVSLNVSPSANFLELDANTNANEDSGKNKEVGFSKLFRPKSRISSPEVNHKKLDTLPHLSLNFRETREDVARELGFLLDVDSATNDLLSDAVIGQRRLNPFEALVIIQACSKAITCRGLETLGIMHPHWYSSSADIQRRLISHFLQSLALQESQSPVSPVSLTSPTSLFESELNFTRSPHDIAAVLRWGLRHLQIEGDSFGTVDGWYKAFLDAEAAADYPPNSYSEILAPTLHTAHLDLLTATLEIFSSLAAHAETNSTSGSKLCKMFGLWLLTAHRIEDKDDWFSFYSRWERTGRMLEHIFLARIRDESTDHRMPVRLLELVRKYPYTQGLSSPTTDRQLLSPPRFTTLTYDALFVRIEVEFPKAELKPKSRMHPLNLLADAFSTQVTEGEHAQLWTKITTASRNGSSPSPLSNIFADETIRFLSLVPDERAKRFERSPIFSIDAVSPVKRAFSESSPEQSVASSSQHRQVASKPPITLVSPLGIGSDWVQFSSSGFIDSSPAIGPLVSTLFDTDIEKTTPPTVSLSRKSSKRLKRKSSDVPRISTEDKVKEPEVTAQDIKPVVKASRLEIVQFDEAFIDFWSDSLLDPITSSWPTFIICKFKSTLVPSLVYGQIVEGQQRKTLKWLVLEQAYTVRAPAPPPTPSASVTIAVVSSSPSPTEAARPVSPSPSTKKRFNFFSRSLSGSSVTSMKARKREKVPHVGEMGELAEEENKRESRVETSPVERTFQAGQDQKRRDKVDDQASSAVAVAGAAAVTAIAAATAHAVLEEAKEEPQTAQGTEPEVLHVETTPTHVDEHPAPEEGVTKEDAEVEGSVMGMTEKEEISAGLAEQTVGDALAVTESNEVVAVPVDKISHTSATGALLETENGFVSLPARETELAGREGENAVDADELSSPEPHNAAAEEISDIPATAQEDVAIPALEDEPYIPDEKSADEVQPGEDISVSTIVSEEHGITSPAAEEVAAPAIPVEVDNGQLPEETGTAEPAAVVDTDEKVIVASTVDAAPIIEAPSRQDAAQTDGSAEQKAEEKVSDTLPVASEVPVEATVLGDREIAIAAESKSIEEAVEPDEVKVEDAPSEIVLPAQDLPAEPVASTTVPVDEEQPSATEATVDGTLLIAAQASGASDIMPELLVPVVDVTATEPNSGETKADAEIPLSTAEPTPVADVPSIEEAVIEEADTKAETDHNILNAEQSISEAPVTEEELESPVQEPEANTAAALEETDVAVAQTENAHVEDEIPAIAVDETLVQATEDGASTDQSTGVAEAVSEVEPIPTSSRSVGEGTPAFAEGADAADAVIQERKKVEIPSKETNDESAVSPGTITVLETNILEQPHSNGSVVPAAGDDHEKSLPENTSVPATVIAEATVTENKADVSSPIDTEAIDQVEVPGAEAIPVENIEDVSSHSTDNAQISFEEAGQQASPLQEELDNITPPAEETPVMEDVTADVVEPQFTPKESIADTVREQEGENPEREVDDRVALADAEGHLIDEESVLPTEATGKEGIEPPFDDIVARVQEDVHRGDGLERVEDKQVVENGVRDQSERTIAVESPDVDIVSSHGQEGRDIETTATEAIASEKEITDSDMGEEVEAISDYDAQEVEVPVASPPTETEPLSSVNLVLAEDQPLVDASQAVALDLHASSTSGEVIPTRVTGETALDGDLPGDGPRDGTLVGAVGVIGTGGSLPRAGDVQEPALLDDAQAMVLPSTQADTDIASPVEIEDVATSQVEARSTKPVTVAVDDISVTENGDVESKVAPTVTSGTGTLEVEDNSLESQQSVEGDETKVDKQYTHTDKSTVISSDLDTSTIRLDSPAPPQSIPANAAPPSLFSKLNSSFGDFANISNHGHADVSFEFTVSETVGDNTRQVLERDDKNIIEIALSSGPGEHEDNFQGSLHTLLSDNLPTAASEISNANNLGSETGSPNASSSVQDAVHASTNEPIETTSGPSGPLTITPSVEARDSNNNPIVEELSTSAPSEGQRPAESDFTGAAAAVKGLLQTGSVRDEACTEESAVPDDDQIIDEEARIPILSTSDRPDVGPLSELNPPSEQVENPLDEVDTGVIENSDDILAKETPNVLEVSGVDKELIDEHTDSAEELVYATNTVEGTAINSKETVDDALTISVSAPDKPVENNSDVDVLQDAESVTQGHEEFADPMDVERVPLDATGMSPDADITLNDNTDPVTHVAEDSELLPNDADSVTSGAETISEVSNPVSDTLVSDIVDSLGDMPLEPVDNTEEGSGAIHTQDLADIAESASAPDLTQTATDAKDEIVAELPTESAKETSVVTSEFDPDTSVEPIATEDSAGYSNDNFVGEVSVDLVQPQGVFSETSQSFTDPEVSVAGAEAKDVETEVGQGIMTSAVVVSQQDCLDFAGDVASTTVEHAIEPTLAKGKTVEQGGFKELVQTHEEHIASHTDAAAHYPEVTNSDGSFSTTEVAVNVSTAELASTKEDEGAIEGETHCVSEQKDSTADLVLSEIPDSADYLATEPIGEPGGTTNVHSGVSRLSEPEVAISMVDNLVLLEQTHDTVEATEIIHAKDESVSPAHDEEVGQPIEESLLSRAPLQDLEITHERINSSLEARQIHNISANADAERHMGDSEVTPGELDVVIEPNEQVDSIAEAALVQDISPPPVPTQSEFISGGNTHTDHSSEDVIKEIDSVDSIHSREDDQYISAVITETSSALELTVDSRTQLPHFQEPNPLTESLTDEAPKHSTAGLANPTATAVSEITYIAEDAAQPTLLSESAESIAGPVPSVTVAGAGEQPQILNDSADATDIALAMEPTTPALLIGTSTDQGEGYGEDFLEKESGKISIQSVPLQEESTSSDKEASIVIMAESATEFSQEPTSVDLVSTNPEASQEPVTPQPDSEQEANETTLTSGLPVQEQSHFILGDSNGQTPELTATHQLENSLATDELTSDKTEPDNSDSSLVQEVPSPGPPVAAEILSPGDILADSQQTSVESPDNEELVQEQDANSALIQQETSATANNEVIPTVELAEPAIVRSEPRQSVTEEDLSADNSIAAEVTPNEDIVDESAVGAEVAQTPERYDYTKSNEPVTSDAAPVVQHQIIPNFETHIAAIPTTDGSSRVETGFSSEEEHDSKIVHEDRKGFEVPEDMVDIAGATAEDGASSSEERQGAPDMQRLEIPDIIHRSVSETMNSSVLSAWSDDTTQISSPLSPSTLVEVSTRTDLSSKIEDLLASSGQKDLDAPDGIVSREVKELDTNNKKTTAESINESTTGSINLSSISD